MKEARNKYLLSTRSYLYEEISREGKLQELKQLPVVGQELGLTAKGPRERAVFVGDANILKLGDGDGHTML